jgi:hypothetical protein
VAAGEHCHLVLGQQQFGVEPTEVIVRGVQERKVDAPVAQHPRIVMHRLSSSWTRRRRTRSQRRSRQGV